MRKPNRSLVLRRVCAVREMAALGQDAVDIAVAFDISISYARHLACLAGVSLRARHGETPMRQALRRLRGQGLTYSQISQRIGHSVNTLKVTAHEMGLTKNIAGSASFGEAA